MNRTLLLTLWLFLMAFAANGQTIGGASSVCTGGVTTLTGSPAGGTWSSSNTAVATVSTSGVVTAIASGVATITYDIGTGSATSSVTVNPSPAPIIGTTSFCDGYSTTFTNATPGGTWSSSSPVVASIAASGIATGISPGAAVISYALASGCAATTGVTVNATPAGITGTMTVCPGTATTLANGTAGGTWSSSAPGVSAIGSTTGIATGLTVGTTTISYSLSTGCRATSVLTVNPNPSAITGTLSLCTGATTLLSNSTGGGTWSSSDITVAPVGPSGTVSGYSAGTATISYTLPGGCAGTSVVTVNQTPGILGSTLFCNGTSTNLTGTVTGGTWTSSNPGIASFTSSTSGILTGVSVGVVLVTYTLPTSCRAIQFDTVQLAPNAITGSGTVCVGSSAVLGNTVTPGTWSSSPASVLTIGATTGVITGVAAGSANITYTISTGCYRTTSETVNAVPGGITGSTGLCTGSYTTLSNSTTGGSWTSSSSAVATIGVSTGIVSGISPGAANISYTLGTGCFTTTVVTVAAAPSAGSIAGPVTMCAGSVTTVSSTVSGGLWSSGSAAVATVGASSGIVTAVAAGATTLTYAVSNSCGTAIATATVTVSGLPAISGGSPACIGLTSTLSATPGCGTWSSGSSSVATATALGTGTAVVTGIAAGIATISFTSCGGCVATTVVTITATPPPIVGTTSVCIGAAIVLDDSLSGGVWTSSNPSVATISTVGSSPGVVTGIGTGTAIMTYTLAAGCATTLAVTVHPLPVISASAIPASCGGSYVAVASGGSSYSWAPSTGVSCGSCATTTIMATALATYTVTGSNSFGCTNTATVSINGNRIYGHISFSGPTPSATDMKVWLIQFNPSDSSLIAVDSTLTCIDSTLPYYQFTGKPAGSYLVKAKLLSSIAGSSDYFPTYGYSGAHWNLATSITHGATADVQDIRMMYGTVLSGPGFISGYIYAGAGKGTATAAPVNGMLVYLKNVITGVILNYTYTDATGKYSFGSLPFGNYLVYPEEFGYYTTPSAILTVGPTNDSATASFKKHTDYGTITPDDLSWLGVTAMTESSFSLYPNPCTGVLNVTLQESPTNTIQITIADVTGREVYRQDISTMTGHTLSLPLQLQSGLYILSINTGSGKFTNKFTVQ